MIVIALGLLTSALSHNMSARVNLLNVVLAK